MHRESSTWILLADRSGGRLLHGTRTAQGSPHFEEHSKIEYEIEEDTRGKPSSRDDRYGHTRATDQGESKERLQRMARKLASWLDGHLKERTADRFQVFAPPRLVSALRRLLSPRLRSRLEAHIGDYKRLSAGQLAHHPRFSRLIPIRDS